MLIIAAVIYGAVMFFAQTALFRRSSRKIVHILPLIVIGLVYVTALFLPLGDQIMAQLDRNDGYSFYAFVALLVSGVNTVGLVADGVAWLVWKV